MFANIAAIKKADESGKMTNALGIEVGKDKVRFLVNGTEVASQPLSQVDSTGVVGLRVNHNLNVHVDGFREPDTTDSSEVRARERMYEAGDELVRPTLDAILPRRRKP